MAWLSLLTHFLVFLVIKKCKEKENKEHKESKDYFRAFPPKWLSHLYISLLHVGFNMSMGCKFLYLLHNSLRKFCTKIVMGAKCVTPQNPGVPLTSSQPVEVSTLGHRAPKS